MFMMCSTNTEAENSANLQGESDTRERERERELGRQCFFSFRAMPMTTKTLLLDFDVDLIFVSARTSER